MATLDPTAVRAAFFEYFAERAARKRTLTPSARAKLFAELERLIQVSCATAQRGYYPCYVRIHGRSQPYEACSVLVSGRGKVTDARCARERPPIATTGYVDCASVGHVVAVPDPTSDVSTEKRFGYREYLHAPWIDLTNVRVAVSASQLCVDYTTVGPVRPVAKFILWVSAAQPSSPAYLTPRFEAYLTITSSGPPKIELFQENPISGQAGTLGLGTSLVINLADLPARDSRVLRGPFKFHVTAIWTTAEHSQTGGGDYVPKGPELPHYP